MRRFCVQLVKDPGSLALVIPPASKIAEKFNVKWTTAPDTSSYKMTQYGMVDAEDFCKLEREFDQSGFYAMFEDIQFHTH